MAAKQLTFEDAQREIRRLGGDGILTATDLPDLHSGTGRVFRMMLDGRWYSAEQIELAAGENGVPAREGLRRMRDIRKIPGFDIERKRLDGTRQWVYRLVRVG